MIHFLFKQKLRGLIFKIRCYLAIRVSTKCFYILTFPQLHENVCSYLLTLASSNYIQQIFSSSFSWLYLVNPSQNISNLLFCSRGQKLQPRVFQDNQRNQRYGYLAQVQIFLTPIQEYNHFRYFKRTLADFNKNRIKVNFNVNYPQGSEKSKFNKTLISQSFNMLLKLFINITTLQKASNSITISELLK